MIDKTLTERIINTVLDSGCDYAEVFYENTFKTNIQLSGDALENGSAGVDTGVGIRLFKGTRNIYCFTNAINEKNLLNIARNGAAALNAKEGAGYFSGLLGLKAPAPVFEYKTYPQDVSQKKKLGFARSIVQKGMDGQKHIKKITVNYLDYAQNVIIANSEGLYVQDERIKTRIRIGALAEADGSLYMGYAGKGAMKGFELYDEINIHDYTKEACRMAVVMAEAEYAPAGRMSVIVDSGFGGLLFHEACGHSLEGSSVSKGLSEFSGRLGQKVASEIVTLIDEGNIENSWGSLSVDDEGTPTGRNVLIEKGVLKSFMLDKLNGRRMHMASTGNARRESYRFAPSSRMTNTYIENGTHTKEEIIANTDKGIYVKNMNAGSVNSVTGEFNFSALESYLVENGKIIKPVKGVTLIGRGSEILQDVDMVGNNLQMGEGYCFAESGALFICAGQPTVRIKEMTVGGVRA